MLEILFQVESRHMFIYSYNGYGSKGKHFNFHPSISLEEFIDSTTLHFLKFLDLGTGLRFVEGSL